MLKIRTLTINTTTEVTSKIIKEVLDLYKVKIVGRDGNADYLQLSITNAIDYYYGLHVFTRVQIYDCCGQEEQYSYSLEGYKNELASAEINRMIKLNVYRFFRDKFKMPQVSWGILYGVRPTKIVHRWLKAGMDKNTIVERLQQLYDCSVEKSLLITDIASRQIPYLSDTSARMVSIYVSIPFCLTRCLYCSFPANILPKRDNLNIFMKVLKRDLEAAREDVIKLGLKIQSIYIGGGTPTSLPDEYFSEMLELIHKFFYDNEVIEFTVEAGRPDTITDNKINTMSAMCVTRVSVNPQSMNNKTLKLVGRNHTSEDIVDVIHRIAATDKFNINMDLILGLPCETVEDVEYTINEVAKLNPDDITIHALAIKKGSPLKAMLESNDNIKLPTDEEVVKMYDVVSRKISDLDMNPYYLYRQGYISGLLENVGYAKIGAESIYNIQIMEENQTIIGIGCGATTKVVDCCNGRLKAAFNAKDLRTYLQDIDFYINKRRTLLHEAYNANLL